MIEIQNKLMCSGCHACSAICPKQCITMECDAEGFWYPQVNATDCIHCDLCEKVCPILHPIAINKTEVGIDAYAAYNKKEETRINSSSGGIFTEIAGYVIRQGGVVFGAAFNERFEVLHSYTETVEGLEAFRGAKYVQSKIGNAYETAKRFLQDGRTVLFTGTPCQIGGLLSFLKKDYENLITQDIICHGVPSPMVWNKYLRYREKKAAAPLKKVCFRDKSSGWKSYSVCFAFSNNASYSRMYEKDLYFQAFLKDMCLRPSCYECAFKGMVRVADITLADYWGIQKVMPEMDDDKGTSLVFVHSQKGRQIFEALKKDIVYRETDPNAAVQYNPSMLRSVVIPPNRDSFMQDIQMKPINRVIQKYCKRSFLQRVIEKLRRCLH